LFQVVRVSEVPACKCRRVCRWQDITDRHKRFKCSTVHGAMWRARNVVQVAGMGRVDGAEKHKNSCGKRSVVSREQTWTCGWLAAETKGVGGNGISPDWGRAGVEGAGDRGQRVNHRAPSLTLTALRAHVIVSFCLAPAGVRGSTSFQECVWWTFIGFLERVSHLAHDELPPGSVEGSIASVCGCLGSCWARSRRRGW
jgi:hypothetical protein